jgi:acyl-CoA synthetase (NDP forming)
MRWVFPDENILGGRYEGEIFPINPNYSEMQQLLCYNIC